jgi:membrane protein
MWRLIGKAGERWLSDNALELGAALAYYAAFSIAPLFIIALSFAGLFYRGDALAHLHFQVAELIGIHAADALTGAIHSIHTSGHGTAANVISAIVLLIGASSVFGQLQNALNRIWGVQPKPGHFWKDLFRQRLVSFAIILGISFLLLTSLVVSSVLAAVTGYMQYLLPGSALLWHLLNTVVSFAVVVGVFAAIYKIIPDVHIDWQDVWTGATVTAVLFVAGNTAIGFYLGRSGIGSAYGAAGSLFVGLAWVYYSSQILFLGAEFTKLYAEDRRIIQPVKGARLRPDERKAS